MKDDLTTDAVARRRRLEDFALDAENALNEYADTHQAVDEKTARLRALRLARDAAQQAATKGSSAKPRSARAARKPASDDAPAKRGVAPAHHFASGQRVKIIGSAGNSKSPRGFYRIVALLPADQNGNHYRVRSELESHDRVVRKSQLSRVPE